MWDLAPSALFCSLLNSLILSLIFCEATDKPLAFQFANKTQQSQGQRLIVNWEWGFINEMKSLFFSLMKRTKNQGFGSVVKAQISILWVISLRGALFCSLLNSLILSVIFCEATDKSLAFQFANKTQQSQGQRKLWIMIFGIWMKLICHYFIAFWKIYTLVTKN